MYTSMYIHLYLGGGFKYFLCSSSLGDIIRLIFFSDGLVQPPTRKGSMVENWCFFFKYSYLLGGINTVFLGRERDY